jgi:hypothetical protein
VAGEQDRRVVRPGQDAGVAEVADGDAAVREDLRDMGRERRFPARLGGDVDQLERARGEPGCKVHAAAQ